MIWVAVIGFIIGVCLGSLTKVIADRSLTSRTFWGRSSCGSCKKQLAWYDLVPIFSYLFLRGKCRDCHAKLSPEYLLIELLSGLLVAGLFVKIVPTDFLNFNLVSWIGLGLVLLTYLLIVVTLVAVFLTDIKTGYIPDRITYPSIWLLFGLLIATAVFNTILLYLSLSTSEIGKYLLPPHSTYFYTHALDIASPLIYGSIMAVLLGLFFFLLIILTQGKGMGGGDLKLGVFLGLAFGFPSALVVMMLSFLLGSVFGIGLIIFGKKKFGQTLPFGPFMSAAGVIVIFFGNQILNWYLSINTK